jgi:hypothetical protein
MLAELEEERRGLQLSRRIAELVKLNETKLPPLPSPPAERLALAHEIITVTQARETLGQIAASFDDATARQAAAAAHLPIRVIEATRATLLASFTSTAIVDATERMLAQGLDSATLQVGLAWERSDLGQRMNRINADTSPEHVAGRDNLAREFLNKGTPTNDPRARVCAQADILAAMTDSALPFVEALFVAATMPAIVANGQTPDIEDVRRAMVVMRPLLREVTRQSWLAHCMFDYRELSDAELAQWLEFLGTDAGGRYQRAASAAQKDAMLARTEVFAHTLLEVMLAIKREGGSS